MDKELEKIQRECTQLSRHEFSFENLVFQSVGLKGIAYVGVYRALEMAGAVGQLKRVAGCGTGSIAAAMVAASLSSLDMEDAFSSEAPNYDIEKAACGLLNFKRQYGWKSAEKVSSRLGNILKKKFGSSNITFKEVYERKGIELCIVVTNVSRLREEYCHPKTTPNMPVKVAVKMSLAVAGLVKPCKYKVHDTEDYFVDGSVVTPYPLHCFDGWYLSTKPEDSFLCRLKPHLRSITAADDTRFGTFNDKTIGVVMFGSNDRDTLRRNFEVRDGVLDGKNLAGVPNTNLLRNNSQKKQKIAEQEAENKQVFEAATKLMQAFTASRLNMANALTRKDLDQFISTGNVRSEIDKLFGSGSTARDIMKQITKGKSKRVTFREIVQFLEAKVGGIHSWMSGNKSFDISSEADFNRAMNATTSSVNAEGYLKPSDSERTIGINTGYIESMDTKIEPGDQKFLLLQGMRATLAFLKFWTQNHRTRPSGPLEDSDASRTDLLLFNRQQSATSQPAHQATGDNLPLNHPSVVFHGISLPSVARTSQSAAVRSVRSKGNAVSQSIFQAPSPQTSHLPLTSVSQWVNQSFLDNRSGPAQMTPQHAQPHPHPQQHLQQNPWSYTGMNPPLPTVSPVVVQNNPIVETSDTVLGASGAVHLPSKAVAVSSVLPPHYNGVSVNPPSYTPGANGHLYPSLPTNVIN